MLRQERTNRLHDAVQRHVLVVERCLVLLEGRQFKAKVEQGLVQILHTSPFSDREPPLSGWLSARQVEEKTLSNVTA
jgi:hypothetical protein